MKFLIVPQNKKSFCHALAESFKNGALEGNNKVAVLDLYKENSPQIFNFITAWKKWISKKNSFLASKWAESITEVLINMDWPGEEIKLTEKENHSCLSKSRWFHEVCWWHRWW